MSMERAYGNLPEDNLFHPVTSGPPSIPVELFFREKRSETTLPFQSEKTSLTLAETVILISYIMVYFDHRLAVQGSKLWVLEAGLCRKGLRVTEGVSPIDHSTNEPINQSTPKPFPGKGMETREKKVLDAMKKAGKPLRPGDVAKLLGEESKEVSRMINELKKKGKIVSPKRCYYSPAE